jgi:hypothetical protein
MAGEGRQRKRKSGRVVEEERRTPGLVAGVGGDIFRFLF